MIFIYEMCLSKLESVKRKKNQSIKRRKKGKKLTVFNNSKYIITSMLK